MNELKIKDTKNVKIDVNIYKIKEYTEYMSDIITAVKGKTDCYERREKDQALCQYW